jgi:hypothetical protein
MKQVRKPLRVSFVVTVAAGAGLFGCSSTVGPGTPDAGMDPDVPYTSENPPAPDRLLPDVPTEACPPATPTSGTACNLAPGVSPCRYGNCAGSPNIFAQCVDGRWSVSQASCNPPLPVCPEERPADGASCVGGGRSCSYEPCYPGAIYYHYSVSCESGRWRSQELICNPPPLMHDGGAPDA